MRAPARFTVSGPGVEDHPVPSVGAGVSVAQTFANRRRRDEGELSFYVRDADGCGFAVVTKTEAGLIETRLTVSGGLEVAHEESAPAEELELEAAAVGELRDAISRSWGDTRRRYEAQLAELEPVDVAEDGQVSLGVPGEQMPLVGLAAPAVEVVPRLVPEVLESGELEEYEVYGSLEELERANETNGGGF